MFRKASKRYWSEENVIDDEYRSPDISTKAKIKTSTEILIGIQQKSEEVIDWLPVISIISAVIICLIAFIILCKRQIDHRRYHQSSRKRRQDNRNNNQNSLLSVDVAECIDGEIEFIAGMKILLAKGNLILDDDDAQMLNSLSTFERLQYFQQLTSNVN